MSEKTKQSFLNFTCKETVWSSNFWPRDWEGRQPWIYLLMMRSFRKVEGKRDEYRDGHGNYTVKKVRIVFSIGNLHLEQTLR